MRTAMRWTGVLGVVAFLGACGTAPSGRSIANPPASDEAKATALVLTTGGLAGVVAGASSPAWTATDAVAAPDGSAIFEIQRSGNEDRLARLDPDDGSPTVVATLPMVPARQVAAVDVDGRRVALATPDPLRDSTLVEVFDPAAQRMVQQATFEGMVQPEAFSPDGSRIYATRSYDSYYRVIVLDLATGRSDPTLGPDKTADPEDMYGSVVQASLSPDKNQLATLYRDSVRPDHTAFVHLLSLSTGTTVCVDLEAPFGVDDGRGTDRLAWLDSATVAIGHVPESGDSVVASFSASDIWTGAPQPHYHALVRTGIDPPELPVGVLDVAGYKRFIAIVDN